MRSSPVVAALLTAAVAGCAEDNTLTGSISQSHDLAFERVELRLLTDQAVFELKYLRALEAGGDDIVARVVVDQPAGGVTPDEPIDLVAGNGRVDRVTAANDPFPDVQAGSLTILAGGVDDGDDTRGEFASTFENGKTLNGTFVAPLAFASFE